jgi:hypothetical protein
MKPWYMSLTNWGLIAAAIGYVVAQKYGLDLDGLVGEVADAVMKIGALAAVLGNMTRQQAIDPEKVMPGVSSASVGKLVKAITVAKAKVMP